MISFSVSQMGIVVPLWVLWGTPSIHSLKKLLSSKKNAGKFLLKEIQIHIMNVAHFRNVQGEHTLKGDTTHFQY